MDSILSTVLGAILALAGGFAATTFSAAHELRRRRRAVASALAAEIQALVRLCDDRSYLATLGEAIDEVRTTGRAVTVSVRATQPYFVVYDANVANIGILDRGVAADVVA